MLYITNPNFSYQLAKKCIPNGSLSRQKFYVLSYAITISHFFCYISMETDAKKRDFWPNQDDIEEIIPNLLMTKLEIIGSICEFFIIGRFLS